MDVWPLLLEVSCLRPPDEFMADIRFEPGVGGRAVIYNSITFSALVYELEFFCSVPHRVPLRKSLLVWACQLWCMLDLSPGSWFYIMEQSLAYIHVQKCGGRSFLLNSLLIPWLTEVCGTFSWECLFISAGCFPSPSFLPLFCILEWS